MFERRFSIFLLAALAGAGCDGEGREGGLGQKVLLAGEVDSGPAQPCVTDVECDD